MAKGWGSERGIRKEKLPQKTRRTRKGTEEVFDEDSDEVFDKVSDEVSDEVFDKDGAPSGCASSAAFYRRRVPAECHSAIQPIANRRYETVLTTTIARTKAFAAGFLLQNVTIALFWNLEFGLLGLPSSCPLNKAAVP